MKTILRLASLLAVMGIAGCAGLQPGKNLAAGMVQVCKPGSAISYTMEEDVVASNPYLYKGGGTCKH
ncbi:MAG: hypothetical protein MJA83_08685 [Gammaproteobacteria bacterium]|nr:hypothetical protein [Gammaproteobacteria bacterium]